MTLIPKKLEKFLTILFVSIALLIIVDFCLPSNEIVDRVSDTARRLENKHSVARNYYYAYYILVEDYRIPVSKDFKSEINAGDLVVVSTSFIFNEFQRITHLPSRTSEIYSFRLATGLFLPIIFLCILLIGNRYQERVSTLVFVSRVLIIIDLVYLIL